MQSATFKTLSSCNKLELWREHVGTWWCSFDLSRYCVLQSLFSQTQKPKENFTFFVVSVIIVHSDLDLNPHATSGDDTSAKLSLSLYISSAVSSFNIGLPGSVIFEGQYFRFGQ